MTKRWRYCFVLLKGADFSCFLSLFFFCDSLLLPLVEIVQRRLLTPRLSPSEKTDQLLQLSSVHFSENQWWEAVRVACLLENELRKVGWTSFSLAALRCSLLKRAYLCTSDNHPCTANRRRADFNDRLMLFYHFLAFSWGTQQVSRPLWSLLSENPLPLHPLSHSHWPRPPLVAFPRLTAVGLCCPHWP